MATTTEAGPVTPAMMPNVGDRSPVGRPEALANDARANSNPVGAELDTRVAEIRDADQAAETVIRCGPVD